ncbi:MAG: NFACT family protein, partial [Deltaproteobacteria bacterium]|nr:NFACT family protein [Deltaproteobacteria bacterium]
RGQIATLSLLRGAFRLRFQGKEHTSTFLAPKDTPPRWILPQGAELSDWLSAGNTLLAQSASSESEALSRLLLSTLRKAHKKLKRREEAIAQDLQKMGEVDALRHRATLILSHLTEIPKNARTFEVLDTTQDPPSLVTISCAPERTPQEEAEHLFRQARKLERGLGIAKARHEQTRAAIQESERLIALLSASPGERSLIEEASQWLESQGFALNASNLLSKHQDEPRLPYRRFVGAGGREILVGRSAQDNDALLRNHARPHD